MTTGAEVKESLWLVRQQARMMADPDLTGDLLLFAIGLLNVIMDDKLHGRDKRTRRGQFERVTEMTGLSAWKCKHLIGDDTPRYEPVIPMESRCCAPMIRRSTPCGQRTSSAWVDRDPITGEATWVGYCRRHLTGDVQRIHRDRIQQWRVQGQPTPPANTGGVLPRYFHHKDWDSVYRWAAPWHIPADVPAPTPPRPVFTLIRGDAS